MGLSESSFWAYPLGSSPGKRLIKVLEVCILVVLVADNAMRDRVWKLGWPLRIHITDGPSPVDFVPCCEHMGVAQGNIWALAFVGAPETWAGLYDAREDARARGWHCAAAAPYSNHQGIHGSGGGRYLGKKESRMMRKETYSYERVENNPMICCSLLVKSMASTRCKRRKSWLEVESVEITSLSSPLLLSIKLNCRPRQRPPPES